MKFSAAAVLAAAAGVSAIPGNVTYTTEVVTALTTYCPAATQITHGSTTYTITEATTFTITDCPCTVTRPVTTISSVICNTCTSYPNSTAPVPTGSVPAGVTSAGATGTGGYSAGTPGASSTKVPTNGAGKVAAAGMAGVVGLAALIL